MQLNKHYNVQNIRYLFLIVFLCGTLESKAQSPIPKIPTTVEPHRLIAPTETIEPKVSPAIEVRPGVQTMPQRARKIEIDPFRGVRLVGGSIYPEQELEVYYRELINTTITLDRVYEIAKQIQDRYRSDGYLLTRVVIPKQTVTDNIFELRIVEGYIQNVRVEGDTGDIQDHIDSLMIKVTKHKPVNRRELERYLLLVNDLAGIEARGVLRPTVGEPGASELVLRLERRRFEGLAVINNRSSEFTGPWRMMLLNRANSMLGLGESLELLLMATPEDEQKYASLSYAQPIGSEGMVLDFILSYGPSEPGHTLEPLEMESKVAHLGGSMIYPWLRSRKRNLYSEFGFNAVNADVEFLGKSQYRDRLRVIHAGGSYDFIDKRGGQSKFSLYVRQGLTAFGASDDEDSTSREEGKSDFTSLQFYGSTHQELFGDTVLYLAAKGQYAFDTLLSDEEFRLGGEQFGRGYDPSELAGEHGVGLSAELQHNVRTTNDAISDYQLYGFYDVGVVWNEDTGTEPRESLASIGTGIRARVYDHFTVGLELAQPLTREVSAEGDKNPRIYLQIAAHY